MSTLGTNDITLYLRPIYALPEYKKNEAAVWLYNGYPRYFKSPKEARVWLGRLEDTNPAGFKIVMSKFYWNNEYHSKYQSTRDMNKYRSTNVKTYGDEAHMYH